MKGRQNSWIRGMAGGLAVLLGFTFAAPCWAGDGMAHAQPGSVKTLRSAADAKLASADTSKAVHFAQAAAAADTGESKPFFKTPKGVAAAVLMVGGLTWMIASRKSDKTIHSPAR